MSNDLTRHRVRIASVLIGVLALIPCQQASASSFLLHEQSTTYLGNAYSGTASTAEDASTGYYNPAGLTLLKHNQAVLSGIYYLGNIKLYNGSATTSTGAAIPGSTAKVATNAIIPGAHFSAKINKKWAASLNIVAPFGLNTRYASNSIARYMATKSQLITVDISPAIAYSINDQFSVGAGFDAMYISATLDAALRFSAEGYSQNIGHAWTYGYHVGALYKPTADTRMGLVYFSMFNPKIRGHVYTLNFPTSPPPVSLRTTISLPDRLVYSLTHNYNPKWTAVADVEFIHWSRLKHLFIQYNNGTAQYYQLDNRNTWRVALGLDYKRTENLMLKCGVAYDESPVQTQYRIAPLPDSDRYWVAIGMKYKLYGNAAIDIGYAHLFGKKCSIQEIAHSGSFTRRLFGNYKSSADLLGLQLTWNFV